MKNFFKRTKEFYIKNYTEPNVEEVYLPFIKRKWLAWDKQRHAAFAMFLGIGTKALTIEWSLFENTPALIGSILGGFTIWGFGYFIEFTQYLKDRGFNQHDAHIMLPFGMLTGFIFDLIRLF